MLITDNLSEKYIELCYHFVYLSKLANKKIRKISI